MSIGHKIDRALAHASVAFAGKGKPSSGLTILVAFTPFRWRFVYATFGNKFVALEVGPFTVTLQV